MGIKEDIALLDKEMNDLNEKQSDLDFEYDKIKGLREELLANYLEESKVLYGTSWNIDLDSSYDGKDALDFVGDENSPPMSDFFSLCGNNPWTIQIHLKEDIILDMDHIRLTSSSMESLASFAKRWELKLNLEKLEREIERKRVHLYKLDSCLATFLKKD